MVEDNLGLVYSQAHHFKKEQHYLRFDDLVGEGNIALCHAARGYDPTRGVKFSTFATRCIIRAMMVAIDRERKHAINAPQDSASFGEDESRVNRAPDNGLPVGLKPNESALATLPPLERLVIELTHGVIDGVERSPEWIAERLGVPTEEALQFLESGMENLGEMVA